MGLFFGNKYNKFVDGLQKLTDQGLSDAYETRRLEWLRTDKTGEKTPEMKAIIKEQQRRAEIEAEKRLAELKKQGKTPRPWSDENRWE